MITRTETVAIGSGNDLIRVRQVVREAALAAGFSLVDQTKIVTAASELARNILDYGGGGEATIEVHSGPGIADIEQAMRDGYITGGGLGLGLGGARRLSNEFEIQSSPGNGTRVTITRWK
jgi:serine/threonine-protein kinase RsbT